MSIDRKKQPVWTNKAFSKDKREKLPPLVGKLIKDGFKVSSVPDDSGLINSDVPEPTINFIHSRGDKVIGKRRGSAQIVFGRDRPSHEASGEGARGTQGANAIDIVVGRMSSSDQKDGSWAHPSFSNDAARIYISQKTKIDLHFGIPIGKEIVNQDASDLSSAIAMKADDVRIIGRKGVKIVSGPSMGFKNAGSEGEKLSSGANNNQKAPPIQLMAGYSENLQAIPMGDNLIRCFDDLVEIVVAIQDAVNRLAMVQVIHNTAASISPTQQWMPGVNAQTSQQYIVHGLDKTVPFGVSLANWKTTYLKPLGPRYILSTNVFTT